VKKYKWGKKHRMIGQTAEFRVHSSPREWLMDCSLHTYRLLTEKKKQECKCVSLIFIQLGG
jgi:hypothetical protein